MYFYGLLGRLRSNSKYPEKSQYFNIIQRKQLHIAAIDVDHLFNNFYFPSQLVKIIYLQFLS